VRSAHVIDGYFNDPDATRAHLDAEGYFRTGDLVERDRAGRVRVIGRSSAAVKLASGEFVALDRVEAALAACPLIDRVMVAPTGDRRGVVAVVRVEPRALAEVLSPSGSSIEERIDDPAVVAHVLYALAEVSARAGLPPRERIVAVTIAQDGWSVADGSLTSSGKLARPGAMARFRDALASVDRATTDAALRENDALAQQLAEIAAKVTGRPTRAHDLLHGAVAADSLEVAELLAAFGERLRVDVPVALWSASATLAALADRLRGGVAAREDDGPSLARLDLSLPLGLRPCGSSPLPRDEDILLTGSTGLLGAHLLEELSVRTNARVRCLVRAMDAPSARARVREALARFHVGALDEARWDVVVGDLCRPDLGLSERDRCALSEQVTSVIHAGASVNWLDGYAALRASNVEGTRALLAFASEREGRALHHVSTISVTTPDGDESSIEPVERALYGSGYGLSKWVSEILVRRAASEGVPVTIHRPGLIVGHSARGVGNRDDFVHRYLSACARLGVHLDEDSLLDMTPADYVARAIVTVAMDPSLRGTVTHLCNVDRSMTFRALGAAMRGLGVPCEPLPYERFRARAVLVRESPLWPLAGYFGASGFRLGSGPWPCARTRTLLEPRGARSPVITPEFIAKILTSLGIVTSENH
jgi:thioester reductase-like protein